MLNGYSNLNKNDYLYSNSTYDAYLNFVSKKSLTLLGTARDLARCKNRETNGSLNSCSYKFLSGYTDMIQCVGVVKSSNNIEDAKQFATFLTNKQSQQNLKNYGLFSTTREDLYEKDYMNDFEEVLTATLDFIPDKIIFQTPGVVFTDGEGKIAFICSTLRSELVSIFFCILVETESQKAHNAFVATVSNFEFLDYSGFCIEFYQSVVTGSFLFNGISEFTQAPIFLVHDGCTVVGEQLGELFYRFLCLSIRQNGSQNENGFVIVHFVN